MRKYLLALALLAGALVAPHPAIIAPGFAQAPPPVPAEPDAERRTRYSGVSNTTTFPVGFDIYGDGTDYTAWVEVWVNGVKQSGNWSLVPSSGSFTTLSRPLLAANLNIVFTQGQTGTVDIVGARRPRRTSQLAENRGVTARDFNQIVTDMWMAQRERWDRAGRTVVAPPGETLSTLPPAATRANGVLGFGATGDVAVVGGQLTNTTVSSSMLPVVQANTLASARAAMGTDNASNLNNGTVPLAQVPSIPASLIPLGIDSNILNAQTAGYVIASSDCGKVVQVTGGPFTVTLPGSTAGFATTCQLSVCNGNANNNTQHAWRLSGFPLPIFARLYMQQCVGVKIVNGSWVASYVPGRFRPAFSPTLYVDNAGSDINDGLISNATGNALATVQGCLTILENEYDLLSNQPTCSPTGGQTLVGSFQQTGMMVGTSVFNITGNGGVATLRPTAGGSTVLTMNDFAGYVILKNIKLDCTGGATNCFTAFFHQQSGADFFSGTSLNGAGTGNTALNCDSQCKINFNGDASASIQLSGTFGTGFSGNLGSMFNFANGLSVTAGTTVSGDLFFLQQNSSLQFTGSLSGGNPTSVGTVYDGRSNSTFCLTSYGNSWTNAPATKFKMLTGAVLSNVSANVIVGTAAGLVTATGYSSGFAPDGSGGNTGVNAAGC